jgi:predicted TIM-barrel fold metal-dependent hydrolase
MRQVPFVDAHVHLWDLDKISYPWLTPPFGTDGPNGDVSAIATTYLLSDYAADAEGWSVAGCVHVDAGADAAAAVDETAWLQAMANAEGRPNGLVAFAALHEPDVEPLLERQASFPNVRGIRHIINWHSDPRRTYGPVNLLDNPNWAKGYALLRKYGLGFDLQAYAGQFPQFAAIAKANPDVPVRINHAGMPIHDERGLWKSGMRALADLPHVAVKISGFGLTDKQWTEASIRPYVLDTIEMFGTDRVMFASDVPTDKLFGTLDGCLSAYANIIAGFSAAERAAMWGGNANRIYRLGLTL